MKYFGYEYDGFICYWNVFCMYPKRLKVMAASIFVPACSLTSFIINVLLSSMDLNWSFSLTPYLLNSMHTLWSRRKSWSSQLVQMQYPLKVMSYRPDLSFLILFLVSNLGCILCASRKDVVIMGTTIGPKYRRHQGIRKLLFFSFEPDCSLIGVAFGTESNVFSSLCLLSRWVRTNNP